MCLQTAEWFTKFGILRIHWVLEAMEGKSICDALGNLPKNAIIDAIQKGEYIFAGSREFVLFLAAKSPKPSVCKAKKDGCGRSIVSSTASSSTPSSPSSSCPPLTASTARTTCT